MSKHPLNKIDVIILAGGLGTRLRNVIGEQQKVVASVQSQPFLFRVIDRFYQAGFRRFILALGYKADQVQSLIEAHPFPEDLEMVYSVEEQPLGTGGALKHARKYIQSETVMVHNGDTYSKIDYAEFVSMHHVQQRLMSIAIAKIDSRNDVGMIVMNERGDIEVFAEKSEQNDEQRFQNVGTYFMNSEVIVDFSSMIPLSLECHVFPEYVGHQLGGFVVKQAGLDIGTKARFDAAQSAFI